MSDTITVQTNNGPREVAALYRKGFFALHRSLDTFVAPYAITHIPTGHVVDYQETPKAGRIEIASLQADPAVNWDFQDPKQADDPEGITARHDRVLIARRAAWGQS